MSIPEQISQLDDRLRRFELVTTKGLAELSTQVGGLASAISAMLAASERRERRVAELELEGARQEGAANAGPPASRHHAREKLVAAGASMGAAGGLWAIIDFVKVIL